MALFGPTPINRKRKPLAVSRDLIAVQDDGQTSPFDVLKGAGKIAIDVLSAPGRTVGGTIAEAQKDGFQPLDLAKGVGHSFDDKYDPSDVLKTGDNFLLGLGTDILLDPLTYIGGAGLVKKAVTEGAGLAASKLASQGEDIAQAAGKAAKQTSLKAEREAQIAAEKSGLSKQSDLVNDVGSSTDDALKKITKQGRKKAQDDAQKATRKLDKEIKTLERDYKDVSSITPEARDAARVAVDDATTARQGLQEELHAVNREIIQSSDNAYKTAAKEQRTQIRGKGDARAATKNAKTQGNAAYEPFAIAGERAPSKFAKRADEQKYYRALREEAKKANKSLEDNVAGIANKSAAAKSSGKSIEELVARKAELEKNLGSYQKIIDDSSSLAGTTDEGLSAAQIQARQIKMQIEQAQRDRAIARTSVGAAATPKQTAELVATKEGVKGAKKQLKQKGDALSEQERALQSEAGKKALKEGDQAARVALDPAIQAGKQAAEDVTQRRLSFFQPFGFKIPGISDALSIPLGRAMTESARRAKFAEQFPRLNKAREVAADVFNPIAGISPILADAERASANIARAESDRGNAIAEELYKKLVKNTTEAERKEIDRVLYRGDELGVELADDAAVKAARRSDNKEIRKLAKDFSKLSQSAREAAQFVRTDLNRMREEALALGIIDSSVPGYMPRIRGAKEGDKMVTRMNDDRIVRATSQMYQRSANKVEEIPNFLQAYSTYVISHAQAKQARFLTQSLQTQVARRFANAEEALAAGFVRPNNSQAAKWLGEEHYLPQEVVDSLDRIQKVWSSPRALNEFTKGWTQFNGFFKNAAYTINPGHLLIDAIGDTWNMWLAGIPLFNPDRMQRAMGISKQIEQRSAGKIKNLSISLRDGVEVPVDDLILMLEAKGMRNYGKSVARSGKIEEVGRKVKSRKGGVLNPIEAGGRITDKMQLVGNWRDNRARNIGFLVQLDKNLGQGMELNRAINSAGNTIRFATFDYNDLTPIEKRVFRNVMPFYTWSRKNIPYQLQMLMEAPGKVTLPFKAQEAMLDNSNVDPALVPDYVRAGQFLLPPAVAEKIPFLSDNPLFFNPMLPSMDLGRFQTFRTAGDSTPIDLQDVLGMLSPGIKAPFELAQGKEFYTGQPITNPISYGLRTFGGQYGAQAIRQGEPTAGEATGPLGRTRRQLLGLSGQFLGLRGYSFDPAKAREQAYFRLADIKSRQSQQEEARQAAGNIARLPFGFDIPNYFTYN